MKPEYIVSAYIDGYPLDLDLDQRLIWLVYCGREYLQSRDGKQVPLPAADPRLDLHVLSCRADVLWREDQDICPIQIRWLVDHDLIATAIHQLTLEPPGRFLNDRQNAAAVFRRVYTNGFVLADFEVETWGQLGDHNIPQRWKLRSFSFSGLQRIAQGHADAPIACQSVPEVRLTNDAAVIDMRVRNVTQGVNSASYRITNGALPALGSIFLAGAAERAAAPSKRLMPPDLSIPRLLFGLAVLALISLPIFRRVMTRKH